MSYELLDSGNGKKLERFGPYILIRPAMQAIWKPTQPNEWKHANSTFCKTNLWNNLPSDWTIPFEGMKAKITPNTFGHLGIFPEHATHWPWVNKVCPKPSNVLNLFAYSGLTSAYLASNGHNVCHVDASPVSITMAKENQNLNNIPSNRIRWIVDDALKFVIREKRRKKVYDLVILDPPTFGRGPKGEVFKIERDLPLLLENIIHLFPKEKGHLLLTCHTPGITPIVLKNLIQEFFPNWEWEEGEMTLFHSKRPLPSGSFIKGSSTMFRNCN